MALMTIPRAEIDRVNAKYGIKRAEPNDPIYSEGVSIMFVTRTAATPTVARDPQPVAEPGKAKAPPK